MSDDASFQDILNTTASDIKPPKALPVGEYISVVDGQPEITKLGVKQTNAVIFSLKPMQAAESVNKDQLIAALDGRALQDKKIRHTIFVTPESKYRIKQFLVDHLGLDGDQPIGQLIPQAMGRQVVVTIGHRAADDGSTIYQEVKSTAHV